MKKWEIFFATCVALIILVYTIAISPLVLFLILGIYFLYLLSSHLDWGVYLLVFLAPMMHWQFRMSDIAFVVERYPGLGTFFAPVVDIWAVVLLLAYGVSLLRTWLNGKHIAIRMPGIGIYSLFLGSALLSLIHVSSWELLSSFKYIIRFPLFVYMGYVFLGANIIQSKAMLERAMKIFLGAVSLGAVMGCISLLLNVWGLAGLRRAVPFAVFGWAPFGDQHIFLAELLVVGIPLAVYFWYTAVDPLKKQIYFWLAGFLTFVCLATFSRAGWLTLGVEAILFVVLTRKTLPWKKMIHRYLWTIVILLPFVLYMLLFLSTKVVALSNAARFTLTDIAWTLFAQSPIIGQGVGTFVDRVSEISLFVYEFGTPIDAHSILDKIASEQGIVGILTFGIFVYWLLSMLHARFKNHMYVSSAKHIAFVSFFLVVSVLVFQLFSTQYYSAKMWVPIMFALIQFRLYAGDRYIPATSNFFKKRNTVFDIDV